MLLFLKDYKLYLKIGIVFFTSILYAIAITGLIIPNHLVSSGVAGISQIIGRTYALYIRGLPFDYLEQCPKLSEKLLVFYTYYSMFPLLF